MSVVSEKTIRRIVQKKILKEGFFAGSRYQKVGDTSYTTCDLSRLKNTVAARKLSKYLLVKPEFKEILDGKTKYFTRHMLLSLINNPLTAEEDRKYEDLVDQWLKDNGNKTILSLISVLEYSISMAFGSMSELYCGLISDILLPESSTKVNKDDKDDIDLNEIFENAFKESAENLILEMRLDRRMLRSYTLESKHLVLIPNTLKEIAAGNNPAAEFDIEKRKLYNLLSSKITIKDFYNKLSSIVYRNVGGKNQILSPIKNILQKIEDNESNGEMMKKYSLDVFKDTEDVLKTNGLI